MNFGRKQNMEENREQPTIIPATALNGANENCAMSEVGSQEGEANLGKFKSVQALMDAYQSLQSEFTKKCQMLSELKKDKTADLSQKNLEENVENNEISSTQEGESEKIDDETLENSEEEKLKQFLLENSEAKEYVEEIKKRFSSTAPKQQNPYSVAWAEVVLNHLKEGSLSDTIINQYVLSDEKVKNKIIEEYLTGLTNSNPPIIMSSQSGERLSGVLPDSPKSLAEAKRIMSKMFS